MSFVVPEGLPRRQAQVLNRLIDKGRAMTPLELAEVLREVGITSKEHAFEILKSLRKRGLVERIETLIAERFPLDRIADAHEAVESGRLIGNAVVEIA